MIINKIKEMKAQRKREKLDEGIHKLEKVINEMEACGQFPVERIDNLRHLLTAARTEYSMRF